MTKQVTDLQEFRLKALQWASSFDVFCYLDSNHFKDRYSKFDTLIAVGAKNELIANAGSAFEQLEQFRRQNPGWLTGFFGYDLKNEVEKITSGNADHLNFPDLYFFVPLHLVIIKNGSIEILSDSADYLFDEIEKQEPRKPEPQARLNIRQRFTREAYVETVNKIQQHISRGDIYVTNFCQEFFSEDAMLDPLTVFQKLNEVSPNPFAVFFKWHNNYAICASPERFLTKRGNKLISQPIKGTAPRGKSVSEDELIINDLRNHPKELQENVMIVDLVRNDLTRSAKQGTVATEELFGIYSFQQVHQMISTVTCEIQNGLSSAQAIKNCFPMGSMTGAPKLKAMQLMEQYERSKRGLYSGAIGYFAPDGDFDFNVVIRTLLYNEANKYLSFHAGSAITYHADADKEYEECLLKVKAIMSVLADA